MQEFKGWSYISSTSNDHDTCPALQVSFTEEENRPWCEQRYQLTEILSRDITLKNLGRLNPRDDWTQQWYNGTFLQNKWNKTFTSTCVIAYPSENSVAILCQILHKTYKSRKTKKKTAFHSTICNDDTDSIQIVKRKILEAINNKELEIENLYLYSKPFEKIEKDDFTKKNT